jgi:hypothetical protein
VRGVDRDQTFINQSLAQCQVEEPVVAGVDRIVTQDRDQWLVGEPLHIDGRQCLDVDPELLQHQELEAVGAGALIQNEGLPNRVTPWLRPNDLASEEEPGPFQLEGQVMHDLATA